MVILMKCDIRNALSNSTKKFESVEFVEPHNYYESLGSIFNHIVAWITSNIVDDKYVEL